MGKQKTDHPKLSFYKSLFSYASRVNSQCPPMYLLIPSTSGKTVVQTNLENEISVCSAESKQLFIREMETYVMFSVRTTNKNYNLLVFILQ